MASVFIASSTESKSLAVAIQSALPEHELTVWDQDVFKPSSYPLEALEQALDKAEFAVFLFAPSDQVLMRGVEQPAVRDNVVLELGMFIGRLGRRRCFIVSPIETDMWLPSDLSGLTRLEYDPKRQNVAAAMAPPSEAIRRAIEGAPPTASTAMNSSAPSVRDLDENDVLGILKDHINHSHKDLYVFADIDRELNLPPGSAKKLIVEAASEWHDVDTIGESTVRFRDKDRGSDHQGSDWFNQVF